MKKFSFMPLIYIVLLQAFFVASVNLITIYSNTPSFATGTIFTSAYSPNLVIFVNLIMFTFTAAILYFNKKSYEQYRKYAENQIKEEYLLNMQKLIETFKAERHDFFNQLQIISGFIQLNKGERAIQYIQSLADKAQKRRETIKTGQPVLDAFFQARLSTLDTQGVTLTVNSEPDALDNTALMPWDIARILTNLIDNAVDATVNLPEDQRRIKIEVYKTENGCHCTVKNSGPRIDPAIKAKIFTSGFTTKGMQGQGMGLHIVQSLVNSAKGEIFVQDSSEAGYDTEFHILLPYVS